jgi:hypothetical protein
MYRYQIVAKLFHSSIYNIFLLYQSIYVTVCIYVCICVCVYMCVCMYILCIFVYVILYGMCTKVHACVLPLEPISCLLHEYKYIDPTY